MGCILCGAEALRHRHEIGGQRVCTCEGCDLTQLHPLPARDLLEQLYGDAYFESGTPGVGYESYAAQEEEYLATSTEEVRRIKTFVDRGRLLEIGCGYGYFLRRAHAMGFDAYGIDAAERAVGVAEAHLPGRVFQGMTSNVEELRNQRFDVVFASHLIEHLSHPIDFLTDVRSRLTEGGIVVLVTPDIRSWLARLSGRRWVSFKIPEHLAYYHAGTITRLLESAGLRVLAIEPAYQYHRVSFVSHRIRQLIRPLDRIVPRLEDARQLRDRILRVTSGSLRVIARQGPIRDSVPGRGRA